MGSANLELVRSIYAAWEGGDFGSVEWADPEIEYVLADGPSPGSSQGLEGMAEATRSWMSVWERWRVEADEYRELDDERVLVFVRISGRGKTSGLDLAQMQTRGANLFHVAGDKVTKLVVYANRERALADLGLDPDTGSSQ